jgi:serine/threonine protein kinase
LNEGGEVSGPLAGFVAPDPADLEGEFPDMEILELLGKGGMGVVYKARQRSLDRLTAIKLFPRGLTGDPSFSERFQQEARVLARLSHPHIVAAYEFGQSDRYCYFVMEFVDGITLRQALTHKRIPPGEALGVAHQICEALAFAHDEGIVHRDIKPGNILLEGAPDSPVSRSGRVRVADFGLAKLLEGGALDFSLTASGHRMGTLHYMAPEQVESPERVDHRADIYAVGVVLYEMLTGELPIGRFPEPSNRSDVSPEIDALVLRCLDKSPENRFQTARELQEALADQLPSASLRRPAYRRRLSGRGRLRWGAIGVLATVALVAVVVLWPRLFPGRTSRDPTGGESHAPKSIEQLKAAYPAEFFLPFPRQHVPAFKHFREGRAAWLAAADKQYGSASVVAVWVHELPSALVPYAHEKLLSASGAISRNSINEHDSVQILLVPVSDLGALADQIDFGKVVSVDKGRRIITVQADPAKLPVPPRPEVDDPNSPDFYRQNLADLGNYDRYRRWRAVKRIRKANPKELQAEMGAALAALLSDAYPPMRQFAAEALGVWGSDQHVGALTEALDDTGEDGKVAAAARAALEAIGKREFNGPKGTSGN